MLPVPERGRGPGQSALEDAGLPEARGHPGAAQPVGEEDRAAQNWGGGRAGPPMGTHHRDGECPHPAGKHLCTVAGRGCENGWGRSQPVQLPPWLVNPQNVSSSMALSPTSGSVTAWCLFPCRPAFTSAASEESRGGQAPPALGACLATALYVQDLLVRDPRRQGEGGTV